MLNVESFQSGEQASVEDLYHYSIKSLSFESSSSTESSVIKYVKEESSKMKLYNKGLYSPGSGEVCAKYITLSRSSVLGHLCYAYPAVKDPEIMEALLFPENIKEYDKDGQELYLNLCKEMNIIPVRCFYRDLKTSVINLKYYGVNPVGIRAMCLALAFNQTVTRLDLTSNFLDHRDACYHLGQLLSYKNVLDELVLDGCKIGNEGLHKLVTHLDTHKLHLLDLSKNNIEDIGFTYLAHKIQKGAIIEKLYLRRNEITSQSLEVLAEALQGNNKMTHLDLSWNKLMKRNGQTALLTQLGHSTVLVELNLAWTSLSITAALNSLFKISTLKVLDLSHNSLPVRAAKIINSNLHLAKHLQLLDLSCNPFSPAAALLVLVTMRRKKVKLKELRMDHITVNKEFIRELRQIMGLKHRKNTVITHGDIIQNYSVEEQDIRVIIMRRLVVVTTKKKKREGALDIIEYLLEKHKTSGQFLQLPELDRTLKENGIRLDDDFIPELTKFFPGPKTEKGGKTINLDGLVDYIHRLWPDKKPPPTPPPTPPPEPTIKVKKDKKTKIRKK